MRGILGRARPDDAILVGLSRGIACRIEPVPARSASAPSGRPYSDPRNNLPLRWYITIGLSRPGILLSLSLWDDEAALVRWRTVEKHHSGQMRGRLGVLSDYHLRVGEVTAVAGAYADRKVGWQRADQTSVGNAKALTIVDCGECDTLLDEEAKDYSPLGMERFEHLTTPGRTVSLYEWPTQSEAYAFGAHLAPVVPATAKTYTVRVLRDYSMEDRREAPEFYPARPLPLGGG
jgi:hypothetical protein